MPIIDSCATGYYGVTVGGYRKMACGTCTNLTNEAAKATQQKIWNTVRVPASEYAMNRAALHVYTPALKTGGYLGVNWNQGSDRAVAGEVQNVVPTHGNSTRQSITRCRPGACSAGGKGVDVKHGSYDRYLARLKGRAPLRNQLPASAAPVALQGNKTLKYGIVQDSKCTC